MPAQQASVQGAVGEEQHQRDERLRILSREEMAMARPLEPPVEEILFGGRSYRGAPYEVKID